MPSNEIVSRHIHKLVQVKYSYHLFFLSFPLLHGFESWMLCVIFFSAAGGNHPHYIGVLESGGEGHVSGIQGGGSKGIEFEAEEGSLFCHGQGQHYQGKG